MDLNCGIPLWTLSFLIQTLAEPINELSSSVYAGSRATDFSSCDQCKERPTAQLDMVRQMPEQVFEMGLAKTNEQLVVALVRGRADFWKEAER